MTVIENLKIRLGNGTIRSVKYKGCDLTANRTGFDNCEFEHCTWDGSRFLKFSNCTGVPTHLKN